MVLVVLAHSGAHSGNRNEWTLEEGATVMSKETTANGAGARLFKRGLTKTSYLGRDTDYLLWMAPTRNLKPN